MDMLKTMNFFAALSLDGDRGEEDELRESARMQPASQEKAKNSKKARKLGSGAKKARKLNGLKEGVTADGLVKEIASAEVHKDPMESQDLKGKAVESEKPGKALLGQVRDTVMDSSKKKEGLVIAESREVETAEVLKNVADNRNSSSYIRWPLVWIDLEMTGLDLEKDRILEIACIITDGRLVKVVEGPDLIITQPEELLAGMGEWCRTHHNANGLVEGVRKSRVTELEAEQQVLEFVRKHTGPVQPLLAGNSVYVDFMFLRKYMPELAAMFSHVIVDVSSIKALCLRWYPKDAERAPVKKKQHRALEDIKESIMELKYMQKTIFKDIKR